MIKVKKHGVILEPTKLPFENLSVFNPGVYQDGQDVHLLYRAQNEKHHSCLGYAKLKGPLEVVERWKKPFLTPEHQYEKNGVEDARIVKIDDTFYLTYVVHDGKNALIAYSYGKDFFNLKSGGVISPQTSYDVVAKLFDDSKLDDKYWFFKSYYKDMVSRSVKLWDKDPFLFPAKFKNKFALGHRILPDIQVIYFNKFSQLKNKNFWKEYTKKLYKYVILESEHGFESRNVGGGAPPIKTRAGWLLIYHGVEPMNRGRIYHAGAALLDSKNPTKVTARLPYPLFSPEEEYELCGHVRKVVFPTGTAIFDEHLYIYYGAADTYTAVASVHLNTLLKELLKFKNKEWI